MKTQDILTILKNAGLKVTPHRIAVYDFLAKNQKPLSVKDIYEKLKKTGVDQVTVYRVIHSFVDGGLVKQIDLGADQAYFEIVDEHDHHHVVCQKCRTIVDFTGCGVDTVITKALQQTQFAQITHHSFELFGLCKKCVQS
jgi:Fe2+ or Zn2+ uptake regulation protein